MDYVFQDYMKFSRKDKKPRRKDSGDSDKFDRRGPRKDSGKRSRFGGRDSGKRGRFGRSGGFGGRRDSGPKEMHEVTCDKCKKKCEVPFKPTGDKPVYCSDCFRKDSGSRDRSGQSAKELEQINAKLDKILKILESS